MPTGLPGDPQEDGYRLPGGGGFRGGGGGGTPGTGFGSGGGFDGGGGGGQFSSFQSYGGAPGGSWSRKLRPGGQPAPGQPPGLSTNPNVGGGYNGPFDPFNPSGGGGGGGGGGGWNGQAGGANNWWDGWASGPGTQPGNSGPEMGDIARWLMAQGGQAGIYDPNGSQGLLGTMRQNAVSDGGAREAGASNTARLAYGDDPQMAAFAQLQARLGSSHDLATSLSGAQQASALQNQQFLQGLTGQMYQQWAQYMAQRTGKALGQ